MRLFCFLIMVMFLFSCTESRRDFFQNLKTDNIFLDTFSSSNLKGLGLSNKSTSKEGKRYYEFNSFNNIIYITGSFRKEDSRILFLPEGSDIEFLFLDLNWNTSSSIQPQSVTTKNRDFYSVTWLGLSYNSVFSDSVYNIKIDGDGMFNHPESLIFQVKKDFELVSIEHINCKHDTLLINFLPKKEVNFKYLNTNTKCL